MCIFVARKRDREAKKRGIPNRGSLYNVVGRERKKILNTLFELLDSHNENVRLGAARTLLNKLLPDLKATDINAGGAEPIRLNIIKGNGFIPPEN